MKTILIKICGDRIYISPDRYLQIHKTNLPATHLVFKAHKSYFWELEMMSYDATMNLLTVKIVSYNSVNVERFESQKPKKKVDLIIFESINWQELEPMLSYYNKKEIVGEEYSLLFTNMDAPKVDFSEVLVGGKYNNEIVRTYINKIEFEEILDLNFNWGDARFGSGSVFFSYYYNKLGKTIDVIVFNNHVLSEFEHIKYWIQKRFGKKNVNVKVDIKCKGAEIVYIKATSSEVMKIDERFVESIKFQYNSYITHPPKLKIIDKSLFTSEDIFDNWEEEQLRGNLFHQSDLDLLNFLMEKSTVRNKLQLMYLSGKLHSKNEKIRFTLHPQFGFLFLTIGSGNLHFIWELLNSHATYMWSFDKICYPVSQAYFKMEQIINTIRSLGRDVYKQSYKNNYMESGIVFKVITHQNAEGSVKDGFPDWKAKIEEFLT